MAGPGVGLHSPSGEEVTGHLGPWVAGVQVKQQEGSAGHPGGLRDACWQTQEVWAGCGLPLNLGCGSLGARRAQSALWGVVSRPHILIPVL